MPSIKAKALGACILSLMAILVTVWPAAGHAGEAREPGPPATSPGPDRFWISPFAGVIFYDGIQPLPNTGFTEDLPRPDGFLIGVRASWVLQPHVLLEATLSRSTTENVHQLLFYDPDQPAGNPPFGVQVLRNTISPVLRIGGNFSFLLPVRGAIVPHLSAGVGWVHHSPRDQVAASVVVPLEDGSVFADTIGVPEENVRLSGQDWLSVDLGGGVTGELTRILSVRLDALLHISRFSPLDVTKDPETGNPLALTGDVFQADPQWVTDLELSTGIVFRF